MSSIEATTPGTPDTSADSADATDPHAGRRRVIGLALAAFSGIAMAVQGRINGALGAGLGDSMLAAVISFGGGLLLLLLALPFFPTMRGGLRRVRAAVRGGELRPWQCLGGIGGATFVAGQSVTVSVIGVALFTVGVVGGQTVAGLVVDRAGIGPAGPQGLTWQRVAGAGLMLAAVAGSLSGGLGGHSLLLLVLPIVGGVLLAVQQGVNGRVGAAAQSPLTAALVNFAVGTAALVLAWLVSLLVRGGPTASVGNPLLYLGGLVGIFFIALAALVVRWVGVLLLGLAAIAGQLVGSVLLDLLLPAHGETLSVATLVGIGVALVAVVLAASGRRRTG